MVTTRLEPSFINDNSFHPLLRMGERMKNASVLALCLLFSFSFIPWAQMQSRREFESTLILEDDFEGEIAEWWNSIHGTPTVVNDTVFSGEFSYYTDEDYDALQYQWFNSNIIGELETWFYDSMSGNKTCIIATSWEHTRHFGLVIWYGGAYDQYYGYRLNQSWAPTSIPRSVGWHKVNIVHEPDRAYILLDGEMLVEIDNRISFRGVTIGDVWEASYAGNISYTHFDALKVGKYADIVVPDDYPTIQEAINAASDGDTIFVGNGTYYENVIVNKTVSLIGESAIIEGDWFGIGISVVANGVNIQGFTIRGDPGINYGIRLYGSSDCLISENQILPVFEGILLSNGSDRNSIYGNTIYHQAEGEFGISLYDSDRNNISKNQGAMWNWIKLCRSSSNIISGQDMGGLFSLRLISSFNNTIAENRIDSPYCIELLESHNNTIYRNEMKGMGVFLTNASSNRFYHNNLISEWQMVHVETPNSINAWDSGCEGNYWAYYNGTDLDGNGISDTPYTVDENNTDHYPLMNLYWHPADINKDLEINIFDAVLMSSSYYATPSDPHWNCHCDIVEPYGIIDLLDIVLMADSYGEEYSP